MKRETGRVCAVVAEDEQNLREELVGHLKHLWPSLRISGCASDGIEALTMIERLSPDIAFLDIQMPGLTGIEVARQLEGRCRIVFVTAYDSHAVAAFEHGAVDYVLKPYDPSRLALALDRVRAQIDQAPPVLRYVLDEIARASSGARNHLRWIKASRGQDVQLILVDDVCYFQADTKYTTVSTARGDAIIRTSLRQLAEQLDPDRFWTIHRSTIVNVSAIRNVTRALDGTMQVILKERPERLVVSEAHRYLFRQM